MVEKSGNTSALWLRRMQKEVTLRRLVSCRKRSSKWLTIREEESAVPQLKLYKQGKPYH